MGTAHRAETASHEAVHEGRPAAAGDRDLVRRVVAGEEVALVKLFDIHRARAFGIALRVLRDPYEAEDAVQETFIQIWTRPQSYDPERGEVAVWIRLIARTRALDRLRRLRPLRSVPREGPQPHPQIVETLYMDQALEGLSPQQRQVIKLSYYEGLTQTEIAERLQVPLGTVKGRVRSGIIRLREALDSNP